MTSFVYASNFRTKGLVRMSFDSGQSITRSTLIPGEVSIFTNENLCYPL